MADRHSNAAAKRRIRRLEKELERQGRTLRSLKETDERYHALVDISRNWIWEVDRRLVFTYSSAHVAKILRYAPRRIVGRRLVDLVLPAEVKRVKDVFLAARRANVPIRCLRTSHRARTGQTVSSESYAIPVVDGRGACCGFRGITRDITEQAAMEEALRDSQTRLTTIIESLPFDVFAVSPEGRYVLANSTCRSHWAGDLLGRRPEEVASDAKTAAIWLDNNARAFNGEVVRGEVEFTIDGEQRCFYNIIAPVWDGGAIRAILGVNIDITDRKRAEEEKRQIQAQLNQAQRLESIGTLAAGVAHDFNNLLTGIQGCASLILLGMDPGNPHRGHLQIIERCVQSGAALTKQLLGLARSGTLDVKPTDLNQLVEESAALFGRTHKEIAVSLKLDPALWRTLADRGRIEQVLVNLYVNARQAMEEGGELSIQTENVVLDADFTKPHGARPGRYAKLAVSDTGTGIDPAIMHRIFDPFFTTKEMGQGTGLGLASAYGIVKSHDGIITVSSTKGKRTTFCIFLPATDEAPRSSAPAGGELARGHETILLVDDESTIVDIGSRMLRELGYTVLAARDGRQTIRLFRKHKDAVALVILDIIMPGMGGGEIFDRLRKIDPAVKVLLASGYSREGKASDILARGCSGFLQKPFTIAQLSQKIREILDAPSAGRSPGA